MVGIFFAWSAAILLLETDWRTVTADGAERVAAIGAGPVVTAAAGLLLLATGLHGLAARPT